MVRNRVDPQLHSNISQSNQWTLIFSPRLSMIQGYWQCLGFQLCKTVWNTGHIFLCCPMSMRNLGHLKGSIWISLLVSADSCLSTTWHESLATVCQNFSRDLPWVGSKRWANRNILSTAGITGWLHFPGGHPIPEALASLWGSRATACTDREETSHLTQRGLAVYLYPCSCAEKQLTSSNWGHHLTLTLAGLWPRMSH